MCVGIYNLKKIKNISGIERKVAFQENIPSVQPAEASQEAAIDASVLYDTLLLKTIIFKLLSRFLGFCCCCCCFQFYFFVYLFVLSHVLAVKVVQEHLQGGLVHDFILKIIIGLQCLRAVR